MCIRVNLHLKYNDNYIHFFWAQFIIRPIALTLILLAGDPSKFL